MKRVVAVIVLVALLFSCAARFAQKNHNPLVPPRNVGEVIVINAEKREQLGLFPGIEEFEEARLTVAASGGYEVEVMIRGNKYSGINEDPLAVAVLCDYIDNYEEYKESRRAFERKWRIVAYDELGFAITSHEVNRARNRLTASMCCGGIFALGAVPVGVGTFAMGAAEGGSGTAALIVGLGGLAGSLMLAGVLSNKVSTDAAVRRIRESRKLQSKP